MNDLRTVPRQQGPDRIWEDKTLQEMGSLLWSITYKEGSSDRDAIREARKSAAVWAAGAEAAGVSVNEQRVGVMEAILGFTAKWAVHAFQRITTSHTYAAALMCSDSHAEDLQDIEVQWHAFMVMLPDQLLGYHDEERDIDNYYTRLLVASFEDSAVLVLVNQTFRAPDRLVVQVSDSLAKLLDTGTVELVHTLGEVPSTTLEKAKRCIVMAKRLVAGLLLALQHQNNFRVRDVRPKKQIGRVKQEPPHRVVMVGKPLRVDCRRAVQDYIEGRSARKNAPPSVQFIVRGHFKRQVVGVGRKGRKVIWVQPYWKGPEDAPILTRPKQVT